MGGIGCYWGFIGVLMRLKRTLQSIWSMSEASTKPSTCPTSAREVRNVGFSFLDSYIDKNHGDVQLNNQGQQHANLCEKKTQKV